MGHRQKPIYVAMTSKTKSKKCVEQGKNPFHCSRFSELVVGAVVRVTLVGSLRIGRSVQEIFGEEVLLHRLWSVKVAELVPQVPAGGNRMP